MLYLITYNIDKEKDYKNLYDAIKNAGQAWWHYIDSTWIIKSSENVGNIYRQLQPHIDKSDNLLIIKIDPSRGSKQGWLPKKAWDWINTNKD